MPAFLQSAGGEPSPSSPSSEMPKVPLQHPPSIPETDSRMVECDHGVAAVKRIFGRDSCVPHFSLPKGIRIAKPDTLKSGQLTIQVFTSLRGGRVFGGVSIVDGIPPG